MPRVWIASALASAVLAGAAPAANAATVEIYAAGSLRQVVDALAKDAGPAFGIEVKSTFGGSGALRQRIEGGQKPDLLMSADLGSPRELAAEGRTATPVLAFARNRMCVVARRSLGVTPANLADRMLAKGVRLKTSAPVADPGGDYAWAIIDKIDALHPGAGKVLRDKARSVMTATAAPAAPGQSAAAALFADHQIDMTITYCSAGGALEKELPDLITVVVPPALDPHPVDGLAVLSTKPEVMRLALYLLSEKGQAAVARAGLLPLLDAPR